MCAWQEKYCTCVGYLLHGPVVVYKIILIFRVFRSCLMGAGRPFLDFFETGFRIIYITLPGFDAATL